MRSAKSVGRIIGAMLFVQLIGLTVPFIMLLPIRAASFLESAAGIAPQIRTAVLLLFANGLLTIGVAIAAFPVVREYSYRAALWLLAFSIIWFSMQAVDNIHILSMMSLSQQFTQDGASNEKFFRIMAASTRSTRIWAHYTELLVINLWFFTFYGLLFLCKLVPRALAAFGLIAVVVHAAGITLPMLVGYASVPWLGFSLALSHAAVGVWLVVKGFREPLPLKSADAEFRPSAAVGAG